ncbi:MAG: hypothetical protein KKC39_05425 [Candidatus Omnitrophica bacterium]|nr:hypothetical protein [Candidatus Omnitrophota bacterium]MBU4303062.1 hypothetical protein [Candidatus Omnitrophota bacterium]MBU4418293.1 hypothetical protein [Candidatus Omnitrophota bacterium]MBU4468158.1 hypothetical protein [Candidatus Omnitrophota bacterium]MCG2707353.1 hypothetical protein [Candidatus Omnitrophota bacterium]
MAHKKGRFLSPDAHSGEQKRPLAYRKNKSKGKFSWPLFLGIACPLVVYPLPLTMTSN